MSCASNTYETAKFDVPLHLSSKLSCKILNLHPGGPFRHCPHDKSWKIKYLKHYYNPRADRFVMRKPHIPRLLVLLFMPTYKRREEGGKLYILIAQARSGQVASKNRSARGRPAFSRGSDQGRKTTKQGFEIILRKNIPTTPESRWEIC